MYRTSSLSSNGFIAAPPPPPPPLVAVAVAFSKISACDFIDAGRDELLSKLAESSKLAKLKMNRVVIFLDDVTESIRLNNGIDMIVILIMIVIIVLICSSGGHA